MKAVMVMFDSLNRHLLTPYGCTESITPSFMRLSRRSVQFDNCYAGSLPCMPARRELHTGRYNFLHRSWGPLEPFDESLPQILKENCVHSHLVSDHGHYWEDGGATYHNRYSTWEHFRGQEGDPWKGVVGGIPDTSPNLVQFTGYREKLYKQDVVNRSYLQDETNHPQTATFAAGIEFLRTNADADNWFLHIETFDPHEPFFTYEQYKKLFPHDYTGNRFDWPDYAPVNQSPQQIAEARRNYLALLTMCDSNLGKILDEFDRLDLWNDTMLIVNTDHGYLLGEHGFWAKNYMPPYEEIAHIPLFIWDPRYRKQNERRNAFVQTIDLAPTLLDFFNLTIPDSMQGKTLAPVISADAPVRTWGLFGMHGAHVCCTDGHFVFMKAPANAENTPLFEYTLMPTHMAGFFSHSELHSMQPANCFSFTRGLPLMRFTADKAPSFAHIQGDLLFDLQTDPCMKNPLHNDKLSTEMKNHLATLLKESDAPKEQFSRLGLTG